MYMAEHKIYIQKLYTWTKQQHCHEIKIPSLNFLNGLAYPFQVDVDWLKSSKHFFYQYIISHTLVAIV